MNNVFLDDRFAVLFPLSYYAVLLEKVSTLMVYTNQSRSQRERNCVYKTFFFVLLNFILYSLFKIAIACKILIFAIQEIKYNSSLFRTWQED